MFERQSADIEFVSRLNDELKSRTDDLSNELHMRVAAALQRLRRQGAHISEPRTPASVVGWRSSLLRRHALERPDGRPIYRYRITDEEYEQAGSLLRELAQHGRLDHPDDQSASLFAAYCAEWFRREAESTFRKWESLAPEVFGSLSQATKAELTEKGLRYWGRLDELIRDDRGRQFLLTLALEGGFSVKLLRSEARGWLKDYLTALIREGLTEPEPSKDGMQRIANAHALVLRESYRQPEFLALCAELILVLVNLRRQVDRNAVSGIDPVAFLDVTAPSWRDAVPIYLPNENGGAARDLLNGLMREKAGRRVSGDVSTQRMLVLHHNRWVPALQVSANGAIDNKLMQGLSGSDGRVRAQMAGAIASKLSDTFAVIDPSVEPGEPWRIRPLLQLDRPILNVPFSIEANVALSQAGRLKKNIVWPGGEAIRSDVLVFAAVDNEGTDALKALRLVGRGSVRAREASLFVMLPVGWKLTSAEGLQIFEPIADIEDGRSSLFWADIACHAASPTDEKYRIEPSSDPYSWRLTLDAQLQHDIAAEDAHTEVYAAPAFAQVVDEGRHRSPRSGELFFRNDGGKWQELPSNRLPEGSYELAWRDTVSGTLRDKLRLVILPQAVGISGRHQGRNRALITCTGLDDWLVRPVEAGDRDIEIDGDEIRIAFHSAPRLSQRLELVPPTGRPVVIVVRLPAHEPLFVDASGLALAPNKEISLYDMGDVHLAAPSGAILNIQYRDEDGRNRWTETEGSDEMSLSSLRTTVESLLALSGDQDASISLSINGIGDRRIRVGQGALGRLRKSGRRLISSVEVSSDANAVLRTLLAPDAEIQLTRCDDARDCWDLPETIDSPALAYIRDGGVVLNRPALVPATSGSGEIARTPLVDAMLIADFDQRNNELRSVLRRIDESDDRHEEFNWLLRTTNTLQGLQPTSIDALRLLAEFPGLLVRLLLNATEDHLAVYRLQRELPFLWLAIPVSVWQDGLKRHATRTVSALATALPEDQAVQIAIPAISEQLKRLIAEEQGFAAIFNLCHFPSPVPVDASLASLANAHVRRFGDVERHPTSDAETMTVELDTCGIGLPQDIQRFAWREFPTLIAPLLLAAASARGVLLKREVQWLIRRAFSLDGIYCSSAYGLVLKEYWTPKK
jgi:hypothetical protein